MRPTQRRSTARSHASTSALVVSSGKRSTTSATCTPGPVVDRRVPLAAVPVEAAAGDAADERDDVRVVGEREDDDRRAVGVAAQLDVGAFLDELHPPSTVAGGAGASGPATLRAVMATGTLIVESIRLGARARRRSRSPRRASSACAPTSRTTSARTGSPRPGRSSRSRSSDGRGRAARRRARRCPRHAGLVRRPAHGRPQLRRVRRAACSPTRATTRRPRAGRGLRPGPRRAGRADRLAVAPPASGRPVVLEPVLELGADLRAGAVEETRWLPGLRSRSSETSSALRPSTSRSVSTACWRSGSVAIAARRRSRASSDARRRSGSSHARGGAAQCPGHASPSRWKRSAGPSARRPRSPGPIEANGTVRRSRTPRVFALLETIWNSHVLKAERCWKRWRPSITASQVSARGPRRPRRWRRTSARCASGSVVAATSVAKASSSPVRRPATSAASGSREAGSSGGVWVGGCAAIRRGIADRARGTLRGRAP